MKTRRAETTPKRIVAISGPRQCPWPFSVLILLILTLLISVGCGAIRRDLPDSTAVPPTDPLPIDGIWRDKQAATRFRIEAGRIWLLDTLVVGPVRIDPGQVVVTELRQTAPHQFAGNDIGASGTWTAVAVGEELSVTSWTPLAPVDSTLVAVQLDDREWYDAQLVSEEVLVRHSLGSQTTAGPVIQSSTGSLTQADAPTTLLVGNRERFGRYHALVIGNNAYQHLPRLVTAAGDAKSVSALLQDEYDFRVTTLVDATRGEMLTALRQLRETLTESDNLLIYYAGHGWLDEEADEGYWLPVDAQPNSDIHWISNATVTGYLRSIRAKHVMVVADSCYSGTLTRGIKLDVRGANYLERIARLRSRIVLSSGGLEPVTDSGGGENSAFARYFIDELRTNGGVLDSTTLYSRIRHPIMLAADQAPELADIRKAGHEGGDFLFIRSVSQDSEAK
jgi:hypothetical protein